MDGWMNLRVDGWRAETYEEKTGHADEETGYTRRGRLSIEGRDLVLDTFERKRLYQGRDGRSRVDGWSGVWRDSVSSSKAQDLGHMNK